MGEINKLALGAITAKSLKALDASELSNIHHKTHQWRAIALNEGNDTEQVDKAHDLVVAEIKGVRKLKLHGCNGAPWFKVEKSQHSRLACMECNAMPIMEVLWAEGMAHAWFCDVHKKTWMEKNVGEVCAERELKWGVASDHWRDGVPTKAEAEELMATLKAEEEEIAPPEFYTEIMKADEEKRYTFSVVYKASKSITDTEEDAHREFVLADELQKALWEHVRAADRKIYVQHGMVPGLGFKKAGEWVEIVSWPQEVNAELKLPGQTARKTVIPADSVWMGVIWEPWAWKLVKDGKIRGFSFGGFAGRVKV